MSTPILATKLYIPPPRPDRVVRQRLIERLNEGLARKLTLVSAPAGFGKTTLICEWVADLERPIAWLSLDNQDSDITRFLTYVVAALQTLSLSGAEGSASSFGQEVLALLQSPQPPPIETTLTVLLNELAVSPDDFILVLDDYHDLDAVPIDQALAFLLEHLPPQMHLVIATREDPQLPLARLRAQSQLTELRATDLRFTPDEAADFLNQVMALHLSSDEITVLETRTEGWIAGIQLAALSMQGRADIPEFIRAFAGDHRYIVDYLVEEVLQRQPEHVRAFLLRTSILDRLSGPLCDAVTAGEESSLLLEELERGNLFVVPLDDKRNWYRYHPLFADVLRAHLREDEPDRESVLHQRASDRCERNGLRADATCHAFAAQDFERAAGLIELAWPQMDRNFQTAAWLGWVKALPDELIGARPVLCAAIGWAYLQHGELEAAETRLQDAAQWLATDTATSEQAERSAAEMVVVDEEQFRSLPATIAMARAYLAQARGDVPGAVAYGQRALDLLPEDDHLQRGITAALLGVAYWERGDLEAARRTLADGMENMRIGGNILFAIRGAYALADILLAQGRLREAIRTYERSLLLAAQQGKRALRGTADLHLRLSELYREQNNVRAAEEHLLRSEDLGEQGASPHWTYRLCRAQARVKTAQGKLDDALDLLDEAERLYVRTPVPDVRPVAALKARVWIAQGKLTEALGWANTQSLSVDDDLSYLREFEHLTFARLLIARYTSAGREDAIGNALTLLDRLLSAAEAGGRDGSALEILVLQALAHEAQDDIPSALAPLERALALAEPEGYVRLFVDEGPSMERLLSEAVARGMMPDYAGSLLALCQAEKQQSERGSTLSQVTLTAPTSDQPLIEPLSQRELEVLQLLGQGLSNREISERLYLALSTVKGHNRNIYAKLQVQRRTQAVARARELGLL